MKYEELYGGSFWSANNANWQLYDTLILTEVHSEHPTKQSASH